MEALSDVYDTFSDLENLDIKKHWTIYFLIDVRVVYIITYAYISIVNLISSTANSEATDDKQSDMTFDVSDEHMDVPVTKINDAVLWNCRDKSLSIFYYRSLYIMALTALTAALFGFWLVKTFTICITPRKHGLTMLWQIAVFQCVKDKMDYDEKQLIFKKATEQIPDEAYKQLGYKRIISRAIIPCCLPFFLTILLGSAYMAYDLHPLACLMLQGDDSTIEYEEPSVKFKVASQLLWYQLFAGIAAVVLLIIFLLIIGTFYCLSNTIIDTFKTYIDNLPTSIDEVTNAPLTSSDDKEDDISDPAAESDKSASEILESASTHPHPGETDTFVEK